MKRFVNIEESRKNPNVMIKTKVLLAMSGGVDSSVAAKILTDQGHSVIGATIKTWGADSCKSGKAKGCCSLDDVADARKVANKLDIPFYVMDMHEAFKINVIDTFVSDYVQARTPNPCIQCNNHIKFGMFLEKSKELGCDYIATGHYAQREYDATQQKWYITEGVDPEKDQTYVLFGLTQEQLSKTLLPIGAYKKSEIRKMASDLELNVAAKPDSQEICFVDKHYSDVVRKFGGILPGAGDILDKEGRVLGQHKGYYHYTLGQRKGLDLPDETPYYVTHINAKLNQVTIGKKSDLYSRQLILQNTNWQVSPNIQNKYKIKIRSRHQKADAELVSLSANTACFSFLCPQESITPGQAAVVYSGHRVLGGGWIAST